MKLFYIQNHSSKKAIESDPRKIAEMDERPAKISESRNTYDEWKSYPSTDHCFYSAFEGINPNQRVDSKSNTPALMHGLVLDYDTDITREEVLQAIKKRGHVDFPISWISESYSGGLHAIIEFEEPIVLLSRNMTEGLISLILTEGFFRKLLPGLDEKAVTVSHHLYYELGTKWEKVSEGKVASTTLAELQFRHLRRQPSKALVGLEGQALPWPIIEEKIRADYPGKWPGEIAEGVRGPRFWDDNATDRTAAVLTEKGVVYYTEGGGFKSWGDLFGHDFVRSFEQDRIGKAVQNIYFDGKSYWVPEYSYSDPGRQAGWTEVVSTERIRRHLNYHGLNRKKRDGESHSEVEAALLMIENEKLVKGAAPYVFDKNMVVREGNKLILNTADCWPHVPDDLHLGPIEWGEGFPFIASWMERMFSHTKPQLELIKAWTHRFYRGAVDGNLGKGQALFLAGPPHTGKTLFVTKLLGAAVGGYRDCSNYVMGNDMFNANLFETGLATIDDEQMSQDDKHRKLFSNVIKRLSANFGLEMRQLYRQSTTVRWTGRVVVTLNDDPVSIRMLPDTSASMAEKVMILKVGGPTKFGPDVEQVIASELGPFCRYIYHYEMPEEVRGSARYGVKEFSHPDLRLEMERSSDDETLAQMLRDWRDDYFETYPDRKEFKGTPTDIVGLLEDKYGPQSINLRGVTNRRVGMKLSQMIVAEEPGLERTHTRRGTTYTFFNPHKES